jgi:hypothetical protein
VHKSQKTFFRRIWSQARTPGLKFGSGRTGRVRGNLEMRGDRCSDGGAPAETRNAKRIELRIPRKRDLAPDSKHRGANGADDVHGVKTKLPRSPKRRGRTWGTRRERRAEVWRLGRGVGRQRGAILRRGFLRLGRGRGCGLLRLRVNPLKFPAARGADFRARE